MSANNKMHPILRDLKSDLVQLRNTAKTVTNSVTKGGNVVSCKITDSNPHLIPFCKALEAAFNHGLAKPDKWDYFSVIRQLAREKFHQANIFVFCASLRCIFFIAKTSEEY